METVVSTGASGTSWGTTLGTGSWSPSAPPAPSTCGTPPGAPVPSLCRLSNGAPCSLGGSFTPLERGSGLETSSRVGGAGLADLDAPIPDDFGGHFDDNIFMGESGLAISSDENL